MTNLEITGSGVAQCTKRQKLMYLAETGLARSNDQDRYVVRSKLGAFAVADGVGGAPNGTAAAEAACRVFERVIQTGEYSDITSEQDFYLAQSGLARKINEAVGKTGGYTTFTGMYRIGAARWAYLHAGDSGLFRLRKEVVRRITSVQHTADNMLTNCMGAVGGELAQTSGLSSLHHSEWGILRIQPGDRYILGTDGVTEGTATFHPDASWWATYADVRVGAQALADFLVYASPRIDDSTAVIVDF